jgi:hypothetical protein
MSIWIALALLAVVSPAWAQTPTPPPTEAERVAATAAAVEAINAQRDAHNAAMTKSPASKHAPKSAPAQK